MAQPQQASAERERISCVFLQDHDRYNMGESAGFDSIIAHKLKERGIVKFNAHKVRNDTNVMGLLGGQNAGGFGAPSQEAISDLIDKKLDEKLAPILELLKEKDKPGSSEPLRGAIKK